MKEREELSSLQVTTDSRLIDLNNEPQILELQGEYYVGYESKKKYFTLEELASVKVNLSFSKRAFDILFSFTFIILIASWLFPLIALAIVLESKGGAFFVQKRKGRHGKLFSCLKFRSMCSTSRDIDENGNYLQATKNDHRITRIGQFLRKTSLDELPQFINIFLGHMSVVGPRPHPEPLNIECEQILPYYWKRHLVKPGLTGLAQVKGYRGETQKDFSKMEKRVLADLIYIRRWNFWLDIRIVISTIIRHPIGF